MKIWFATNNIHKKKELEAILNTTLNIPSEHGLSFNPEETGASFADNALIKARELKKITGNNNEPVIADDSGLCVDSLNGRPGVLSARYGEEQGVKLNCKEKNILLLNELNGKENRTARFICAMALFFNENRFYIIQETLEGEIVKSIKDVRGEGGFGYDPVFFVPKFGRTLAQLSEEEKNEISHRGKAGRIIAKIISALKA